MPRTSDFMPCPHPINTLGASLSPCREFVLYSPAKLRSALVLSPAPRPTAHRVYVLLGAGHRMPVVYSSWPILLWMLLGAVAAPASSALDIAVPVGLGRGPVVVVESR